MDRSQQTNARYSLLVCRNYRVIAIIKTDADPPRIGEKIKLTGEQVVPTSSRIGLEQQDLLVKDVIHLSEGCSHVLIDIDFASEEFREIFESTAHYKSPEAKA